jgi:hypothetical protein
MNRIIALLSALIVAATAFAQKDVTIFTAADDIARPITIKTNSGNYKLYNELRIDKHISWFEAYDGNGNKIMQPGASRDIHYSTEDESRLVKKYHFTTLYPSSSKGGSSSSGSKSSSGKKSHGREENIPEYEGDYSSVYYSNLEEYIMWRLPAPPAAKAITNPEQYCGKWGDRYTLEKINPDWWEVDIEWDGKSFSFSFRRDDNVLVKQETDNSWLFVRTSYTDETPELQKKNLKSVINDCDSDADPGFPRSGTYKYDEWYTAVYVRITLTGGSPRIINALMHNDYYYHGHHTYSETMNGDLLDMGPTTLVRYKR